MSTIPRPDYPDVGQAEVAPETRAFRYVFAATRIGLGFVFLWAFLDKLFALGFATGRSEDGNTVDYLGEGAAWLNGGSPTEGFLQFGTEGKALHGFYASDFFAGAWADWLFMAGLLGIGLALILGIGMRLAAATGALLMVLMWSADLPLENNPIIDDHIIYALVLVALALANAGHTVGLGRQWEKLPVVADNKWLK